MVTYQNEFDRQEIPFRAFLVPLRPLQEEEARLKPDKSCCIVVCWYRSQLLSRPAPNLSGCNAAFNRENYFIFLNRLLLVISCARFDIRCAGSQVLFNFLVRLS